MKYWLLIGEKIPLGLYPQHRTTLDKRGKDKNSHEHFFSLLEKKIDINFITLYIFFVTYKEVRDLGCLQYKFICLRICNVHNVHTPIFGENKFPPNTDVCL